MIRSQMGCTKYQKWPQCKGCLVCSPCNSNGILKSLMNKKVQFKVALTRYLNTHSFYTVRELLMLKISLNFLKACCI
jgi:hypothetical protein